MTARSKNAIFLGPTLPPRARPDIPGCEYLGPAAMGDITRAAHTGYAAIILVDGLFESGPSVWHKEILWAMSKGIPVAGCSSMGALRAAELHRFGMLGFGQVFELYRSLVLEDDDEVAILHGPAETGWLATTDAMVDIRWQVAQAVNAGRLTPAEAQWLLDHAKAMHFKQRSLRGSLAALHAHDPDGFPAMRSDACLAGAGAGLKELDCLALLRDLPSVVSEARMALSRMPSFVATIYMTRLERHGFAF